MTTSKSNTNGNAKSEIRLVLESPQDISNVEQQYSEKNIRRFRIPNETSSVSPSHGKDSGEGKQSLSPKLVAAKKRLTSSPSAQKLKTLQASSCLEEERRKRSWGRLVMTLHRSIDDVYIECEEELEQYHDEIQLHLDGAQEMCQEVIDILEKAMKDFADFKKRCELLRTGEPIVAWGFRPTSKQLFQNLSVTTPQQQQQQSNLGELLYSTANPFQLNGLSWADVSESPSASPERNRSPNAWAVPISLASSPQASHRYQLHQKLSSPTRKRSSPTEIKQKQEEKLAKAEWNRNSKQIQTQLKRHKEAEKVQLVTERKAEQIALKKEIAEEKLQRAQKNHSIILKKKSEEAKNENMKVEEVRFIQKMNTEDNKFQLNKKLEESKTKREKILIERKEKISKDAIKEQQAKLKREQIEQQRIESLQSQIKLKKEKEERLLEEKKQKEAERVSKSVQYVTKVQKTKDSKKSQVEQLKKDHELKMEASAVRKNQTLEQIREKAAAEILKVREAGSRKATDTDTKLVGPLCDISQDKKKTMKKRAKKIRHKILGQKKKLDAQANISNNLSNQVKPRSAIVRRTVQELQSAVENDIKTVTASQITNLAKFIQLNNFVDVQYLIQEGVIASVVKVCENDACKDIRSVALALLLELSSCAEIASNLVASLDILIIIHTLMDKCGLNDDQVECVNSQVNSIISILTNCMGCAQYTVNRDIEVTIKEEIVKYVYNWISSSDNSHTMEISYLITLGLFDILKRKFLIFVHSCDTDINLHTAMSLLSSMLSHVARASKVHPVYLKKEIIGSATLVQSLKETTILGILPLLTTIVLSDGSTTRATIDLSVEEVQIVYHAFQCLNCLACLDLNYLQETLGDTFQSELFHIVSNILTYCTSKDETELETNSQQEALRLSLLNEMIILIGFFTLLHENNQGMLQFNNGRSVTLLQRLCSLPIQYFTDPTLQSVLLPTLISICFKNELNKEILEQELSTQLITAFIEQDQECSRTSTTTTTTNTTFTFRFRFPPNMIQEALAFFKRGGG